MSIGDIEGVLRVADTVHPNLPESEVVFTERMKLFPEGCLVLVNGDVVCGYVISHPIRHGHPPALDSLLGEIATNADQFYIHDLAILPNFRGCGHAAKCIRKLFIVAQRYQTTCLVSVYDTARFWGHFGFVAEPVDQVLYQKLQGYGSDATYLTRQNG